MIYRCKFVVTTPISGVGWDDVDDENGDGDDDSDSGYHENEQATEMVIRDLKYWRRRAQRTTTGSKIPLTALLRTLDSSYAWSSGRENFKFAVLSEREYVFMYLRSVWGREFISNYWNESLLFI